MKKIKGFKYDLICYTASISHYANAVLDLLDKNNELFALRLYRENCVQTSIDKDKIYIKDLRIFKNVDPRDMIIIDNSILSFAFHIDNGIPILPYYSNKNDRELIYLGHYLGSLVNHSDLRLENKKFIKYNYDTINSNNSGLNTSVVMFENTNNNTTNMENYETNNTSIVQDCLLNDLSYYSGSESETEGIKNPSLKNMFKDLDK